VSTTTLSGNRIGTTEPVAAGSPPVSGLEEGRSGPVPLMLVEEYLRLTEKPYREYRDGVVTPKAMGTKFHSIIQRVLLTLLQKQGVQAFPEVTVRISSTKYLVPDVAETA
jgi:Uma2 family endonuclease